jgi:hypothetical protein
MEGLLEAYCNYHAEFYSTLEPFKKDIKEQIIDNLENAKNESQFRSTIAELQFGLKFQNLGFILDYEKKYFNKQTPDWTISKNGISAICEVYRLGQSLKDQKRADFENKLIEKLKTLTYNYLVKIDFAKEYFEPTEYNIDSIIDELDSWFLKSKKNANDRITIKENFHFKILKTDTINQYISCVGNVSLIDIKLDKLIQFEHLKRKNEITKKILKYNNLISTLQLPYFIAISIDFISGFDIEDFKEYFLGKGVEFIDFDTPIAKQKQFSHLGKEWTELGIFYDNIQISGLIILYNNSYSLLLNPIKQQAIYKDKNKEILQGIHSINKGSTQHFV